MSNDLNPLAARVLGTMAQGTLDGPLTEAQMNAVRAECDALAPTVRGQVLQALRDPRHPAADRALLAGLENGYPAYLEARGGYSGLRAGQRVGQLDLWVDRDVNIAGPGRGFATLADAQLAARTAAASRDRDAAVFRAPDGSFVTYPLTDLGELGAGENPRVHDLERLPGYRLVSLATDTGLVNLSDDTTTLDTPYGREVAAALRSGRPIVAVTGHGFVMASRGVQSDGTYANRIGGTFLQFTNFTSQDMLDAALAGRISAKVMFNLGCNTAEWNGRAVQMGPAFLKASGARAFVGSSGSMQMGADVAATNRMLAAWRQNPGWTLRQVVDQENVNMRRNQLQVAHLVIHGDETVTYDELLR